MRGHGRIVRSEFVPAPWLRNRHLQTIWPSLPFSISPRPPLQRETLELPDGDVTVVDWLERKAATSDSPPLLLVLHGLESSARSNYARQLLHAAKAHGWRAAVLHFRDCGDCPNRLPRRYHAGDTEDLRYFLRKLRRDGHAGPLLAAGYSLGGNVLLKYLGESGADTPLAAAAAVCVPLDLNVSAEALNNGFSKFYQAYMMRRMKSAVRRKFSPGTAIFDWERAMAARTFAEFDDAVTAPLHGFAGKGDYYERSSAIRFLRGIERPTLIVNARDDPFMTPEVIPPEQALAPRVTLEISDAGGHVGFIDGGSPVNPHYYLPGRIIAFLEEQLANAVPARPARPAG